MTDLDDLRARLESAVHAYREHPDPSFLDLFWEHKLDGIARALEQEARALPGIGRDSATDRIDRWLRRPPPWGGDGPRAGHADGYGLGGTSPTGGRNAESRPPPPP